MKRSIAHQVRFVDTARSGATGRDQRGEGAGGGKESPRAESAPGSVVAAQRPATQSGGDREPLTSCCSVDHVAAMIAEFAYHA